MAEQSLHRAAAYGRPAERARVERVPGWDIFDLVAGLGFAALALLVVGGAVGDALSRAIPNATPGSVGRAVVVLAAAASAYLVTVVPLYVLLRVRHDTRLRDLGWVLPERRGWLLLAFPVFAGTLVLTGILGLISRALFPGTNPQCAAMTHATAASVVAAAVLVTVMAPIAEETLFRGFFYRWFEQHIPWTVAVPVSGVVFALAHRSLLVFLPILGAGIVLALVYRYSRSIWPGAMVHSLNNAVVLALFLTANPCH